MNFLSTLIAIFKRKANLKLGVSQTTRGPVHALVALYGNDKCTVLSSGAKLSFATRLFCPYVVNSDLGNVPVFFKAAEIGKEDPEAWIDRNEETVIPNGITPDQIVNDYLVEGKRIYSATVSTDVMTSTIISPIDGTLVHTLGVPLWNLAKLYGKEITTPFVLWRINGNGSVLGYVENGILQRLCHSFVDCDDLGKNTEDSISAIENIISSLSGDDSKIPVVFFSPEREFSLPQNCKLQKFTLIQTPSFKCVPNYCHEAFANALFGDDGHNFLPFDIVQKASRRNNRFNLFRSVMRISAGIAIGLLLLFGITDGVLFAISSHYREPMVKVKSEGEVVLAAEKKRDLLLKKFRERIKFETGRSHCTTLLSELQTIFSEGTHAESISITETDISTWQCEIQAISRSSSLIASVIENIGKAQGVSNARMTYSEQVTLPDNSKAIRFKLKCDWK